MSTVRRFVIRRKSDGLYNMSSHGWTPDITQASLFVDEHFAHLAVDDIKDVIPVSVTIDFVSPASKKVLTATATQPAIEFCHTCGTALGVKEGKG